MNAPRKVLRSRWARHFENIIAANAQVNRAAQISVNLLRDEELVAN